MSAKISQWRKGKEEVNKEYILNYQKELENKIDTVLEDLKTEINNISKNYMRQIEEINDLQLENPKDYLKEKDNFELYLKNFYEIMKNMQNLDV